MIAAYPHVAFVIALMFGAAVGFVVSGVIRIASDADEDEEPLSDYRGNDGGQS